MAVTAPGSGTQAATIGTEHTLYDVAVAGTFTFHVDKRAMAGGDTLELRIYQMILPAASGGTRGVAYKESFFGAPDPDDQIAISVAISNELTDPGSLRFTLKQVAGTGRSFPWKVLMYA